MGAWYLPWSMSWLVKGVGLELRCLRRWGVGIVFFLFFFGVDGWMGVWWRGGLWVVE